MPGNILVIGAGKMGSALVEGWLANGADPSLVHIVDPALSGEDLSSPEGTLTFPSIEALPNEDFETLLLAVKPQVMAEVLAGASWLDRPGLLVISIAAGIKLQAFEDAFPQARCVRVMPNTPASVGAGVSVCVGRDLANEQRGLVTDLMAATGDVVWIDDEVDMDAVTAVSGSGPAYVFHMVEALAAAGEEVGLAPDIAQRLARQTVIGAGALLAASPDAAAKLRENVTSPGGTTAAGLAELRDTGALVALMSKTVAAAKRRSEELSA